MQRALHRVRVGAADSRVVPRGVVRARDPGEPEREPGVHPSVEPGEREVEHVHLLLNHRVRDVPDRTVADNVEPDGHGLPEVLCGFSFCGRWKLCMDLAEVRLARFAAARGHCATAEEAERRRPLRGQRVAVGRLLGLVRSRSGRRHRPGREAGEHDGEQDKRTLTACGDRSQVTPSP